MLTTTWASVAVGSSAARDGFDRRGRLDDRLARAAAEARAHVPDNLQPGGHALEHLGHVLAKFRQAGATAAGAGVTRMMDHLLARQVVGQRTAHRLLALGQARDPGCRRRCGSGPRRFALFEIFEQQLELRDLGGELLRRTPELHPTEHGQLRGQLLDQQIGSAELSVAARERGFQIGDFSGGIGARHGSDIYIVAPSAAIRLSWPSHYAARFQAASSGRQLATGARQSSPSKSIDSCAADSLTEPSRVTGQMKRPRSSRLENRHRPWPSHHSAFIRSPQRPTFCI